MISSKPTIFCDIDGTLVKHALPTESCKKNHKLEILEGTIEKILEWETKGYRLILTTGRKECSRKITERQLSEAGIIYDQLIMNIGGGARYLINDKKSNGEIACYSFSPIRDQGIKDIEI